MGNLSGYNMVQKHKTYSEYLAESKKRPVIGHAAPSAALPKYSKGDTPGIRAYKKEVTRRSMVEISDLHFNKNGTIKTKIKELRKKIYTAQEQGNGR